MLKCPVKTDVHVVQNLSRKSNNPELEGRHSVWKVTTMITCKETKILGIWGPAPRKMFQVTPSRMSENALLQNRIYIVLIIDLCAEK